MGTRYCGDRSVQTELEMLRCGVEGLGVRDEVAGGLDGGAMVTKVAEVKIVGTGEEEMKKTSVTEAIYCNEIGAVQIKTNEETAPALKPGTSGKLSKSQKKKAKKSGMKVTEVAPGMEECLPLEEQEQEEVRSDRSGGR